MIIIIIADLTIIVCAVATSVLLAGLLRNFSLYYTHKFNTHLLIYGASSAVA
jgi:hypothetical protein